MAATVSNVALNQIAGAAGGPVSALVKQSVPDWLDRVQNAQVPLVSGITKSKAKPKNSAAGKFVWGNEWDRPLVDQLAEADDGSETTLTVDHGEYFAIGDLIQIGTEIQLVENISGDDLTVQRGINNSGTGTSHADDSTILILAPAYRQNQDTQLTPIAQGELYENQFQQMEFKLTSAHKNEVFPTYETEGKGAIRHFAEKLMKYEALKQLENLLIHSDAVVAEDADTPAVMGGIFTAAFTENRDSISGALTITHLMDALQDTWKRSNDGVDLTVMCGPYMARVISSFFSGMRRADATTVEVATHFERIKTPWGTLTITPNPNWYTPSGQTASATAELNKIFIGNLKDIELIPAPDAPGDPSTWNLGYDAPPTTPGWYKHCYLRGMYTLGMGNPLKRTILYGFSVDSSAYPNNI